MDTLDAAITFLVVLLVIVFALWGPIIFYREKATSSGLRSRRSLGRMSHRPRGKAKEGYGPPPGMARAVGHNELGHRGSPDDARPRMTTCDASSPRQLEDAALDALAADVELSGDPTVNRPDLTYEFSSGLGGRPGQARTAGGVMRGMVRS